MDYGLAPIENSLGGGIVETLDAFKSTRGEVGIYAEALSVHHSLLANCEPRQVRRIHSKPEVFSQCRTWLATQYPNADLIPAASSSRAAADGGGGEPGSREHRCRAGFGGDRLGAGGVDLRAAGPVCADRTTRATSRDLR